MGFNATTAIGQVQKIRPRGQKEMAWRAQHSIEQYRKLCPTSHSRLALGSADFDYYLRYEVYSAIVRALNRGQNPEEAYEYAKAEGRECVRLWNERGHKSRAFINSSHELKRYEHSAERYALAVRLMFQGIPDPLEET